MPLIRILLARAARRIASDPRAQAKAVEVFHQEVAPRAAKAWQETKPRLSAAKDELKDLAGEADPLREPARFAGKLARRIGQVSRQKQDEDS